MFYKRYNLLFPTSWLSMIIRACLCALDWNYNVKRPHKLDEFGKAMYREKVVIEPYKRANFLTLFYTGPVYIQVDRTGNSRTVVPVLVDKDTSWQDKIVDMCVASLESGSIPNPQVFIPLGYALDFIMKF